MLKSDSFPWASGVHLVDNDSLCCLEVYLDHYNSHLSNAGYIAFIIILDDVTGFLSLKLVYLKE